MCAIFYRILHKSRKITRLCRGFFIPARTYIEFLNKIFESYSIVLNLKSGINTGFKVFSVLFITFVFALCFMFSVSNALEEQAIDKAVSGFLAERIPLLSGEIHFEVENYPQKILSYDGDGEISIDGDIPPIIPRYLPLEITIDDSAEGDYSCYLKIRFSSFKKVVVSKQFIRKGEFLSNDNCLLKSVDVIGESGGKITDLTQLEGLRARKNLNEAEVLTDDDMEPIPDVFRGGKVKITAEFGTIKVAADGIAREDGWVGDYIRVKNLQTNKTVTGKLNGSGEVEVVANR
ncbi:MAG: flagellar basal body P-ring formation protein FlgA [candidate division Zixibacteria bacterium]|nr:flagellar basal body P-ring formation protein FlgA [candidate division Zixibacteria bacterium]